MKITIHLAEKEAHLIAKALDVYCRIGICQFWNITEVDSLQKILWSKSKKDEFITQEFEQKTKELSNLVTGLNGYGSYGIFSKEVGDDVRIAAHLCQEIKRAYPADICQIAKIKIPEFKISINKKD